MSEVSIIVPVLNEAAGLEIFLQQFSTWRDKGDEVVVVDGGSEDASFEIATGYSERVISSARGRAIQLNTGAQVATGKILWFVHADTKIVPGIRDTLIAACSEEHGWGRFDVAIEDCSTIFRAIEIAMNVRSRVTGIATGDQGIFVRREWFIREGGFRQIALMEDVELSKALRKQSRPRCLEQVIKTSSRRWRSHGIVKTIFMMWFLRLAWFLGASPDRLAQIYGYGKS